MSILLFLLPLPSLFWLSMKTATLIKFWPLNLRLLFEFLPLCYIFYWSKPSDPQNYIILMRSFYDYIKFENFGIHNILQLWSGKRISKPCYFQAKHFAWVRKVPIKSFYIWQCMIHQSFVYYSQILTTLFSSIFLWTCKSPMIFCFVYCVSISVIAVDFVHYFFQDLILSNEGNIR